MVPDLVVFAKGVTTGYVPLGGVVVHERVADHPLVTEVRAGTGVLGALELDPSVAPAAASRAARERGVLIRPMTSALGFSPPRTATTEHLDLLVDGVRGALDSISR